jgi:hypothetical protein
MLLYYYGYPRLLNNDVKKQSLDRESQNSPIHRQWHPTFHLGTGTLKPPVVTFAEKARSRWGPGLSPGLSPFWAFPVEVPLLSTMAANSKFKPP